MRYWLVMPAAGSGSRFGGAFPKQYAQLAGRTVIEWALAPFLADRRCAGIVVALAPQDREWARIEARLQPAERGGPPGAPLPVTAVPGGAHRSFSVRGAPGKRRERAAEPVVAEHLRRERAPQQRAVDGLADPRTRLARRRSGRSALERVRGARREQSAE